MRGLKSLDQRDLPQNVLRDKPNNPNAHEAQGSRGSHVLKSQVLISSNIWGGDGVCVPETGRQQSNSSLRHNNNKKTDILAKSLFYSCHTVTTLY